MGVLALIYAGSSPLRLEKGRNVRFESALTLIGLSQRSGAEPRLKTFEEGLSPIPFGEPL